MKIRPAKLSDYEEFMELYNLFVEEDRYSNHGNDSFEKVLNDPRSFIVVAEEKNMLIGFATFSVRHVVRYPGYVEHLKNCLSWKNTENTG